MLCAVICRTKLILWQELPCGGGACFPLKARGMLGRPQHVEHNIGWHMHSTVSTIHRREKTQTAGNGKMAGNKQKHPLTYSTEMRASCITLAVKPA
jgi:hypothetical protein